MGWWPPQQKEHPMTRKLVSTGSPFEETYAYSRAVAVGNMCFVAGTTGYDYAKMEMPDDPAAQTRNIFETIGRALADAGFALTDIVRLQVTVTDVAHWEAAAPVVGEFMGEIRPANTTVISELIAPEMKIEIEATAVKG
jgi:enamine deaminase RidA (YjgF/YER057c/UK114 family)